MFKLAVSNIGWSTEQDDYVYDVMRRQGYSGLEIAPTRIFPEAPYDKGTDAGAWSEKLKKDHGFMIPSMQSIWFGRQENIFGSSEERQILLAYTKKAVDFAKIIKGKNLVFGCPKNRNMPEGADPKTGVRFLKEIADYALEQGIVIGMEANPPIYHTNYINDTPSALALIEEVDSEGFRLNLDVGTMIQNEEHISELEEKVHLISHVHISEPGLKPIEERALHRDLKKILEEEGYQGFVSIEMGKVDDIRVLEDKMQYIRSIFG